MDKIRVTLDLLIEHEEIKPEQTLRATFDKYLHPDVIDKESKQVYDILSEDSVTDVFQFSTDIGREAIKKVQPSNLIETASLNSLMRLMSDTGEQPIDTFIRHKNNINEWYAEMRRAGLDEDEIEIMKDHLLILNGVADTQESIMLISMDERISNFSVVEATRLRKVISGANRAQVNEIKELFLTKGAKQKTNANLLNYIWDFQISRQLEYSFSICHVIPYTLMALQEINLNIDYNPIYWETACLTVNSGSIDSESETKTNAQTTNYGKIASAIGDIQAKGLEVTPPKINSAGFGFTPDIDNQAIIYGLKGMIGVGDDAVNEIINNRPYHSFEDFVSKVVDTKLVSASQTRQLIKSGAFNEFGDRVDIMHYYLKLTLPDRESFTMASFNTIRNLGVIPEEYALIIRFYDFRKHIMKKVVGKVKGRKTKNRLFLLDEFSTDFLYENFSTDMITEYKDETVVIREDLFEKEYALKIEPAREWLARPDTVNMINQALFAEEWEHRAQGTISQWEMDSLSYYYTEHELAHIDKDTYQIKEFSELPAEPIVTSSRQYFHEAAQAMRTYEEYALSRIVGTVVDKDSTRHTVSLLTPTGVVVVKLFRNTYSKYDRQLSRSNRDGTKTIVERSWFRRGTLMMFTGYRRGNQFIPRVYRNSIFQSPISRIVNLGEKGTLNLISDRVTI